MLCSISNDSIFSHIDSMIYNSNLSTINEWLITINLINHVFLLFMLVRMSGLNIDQLINISNIPDLYVGDISMIASTVITVSNNQSYISVHFLLLNLISHQQPRSYGYLQLLTEEEDTRVEPLSLWQFPSMQVFFLIPGKICTHSNERLLSTCQRH